jgi:hypothetical protein
MIPVLAVAQSNVPIPVKVTEELPVYVHVLVNV